MENYDIKLNAHIDMAELDKTIEKAERLCELMKEAKLLARELASTEINLSVNVD